MGPDDNHMGIVKMASSREAKLLKIKMSVPGCDLGMAEKT